MRGARRALVERKRLDVLPSPPRKRDDERLEKKKNSPAAPTPAKRRRKKKTHRISKKRAPGFRMSAQRRRDAESDANATAPYRFTASRTNVRRPLPKRKNENDAHTRPDRPGPRSQSFFRRYGSILPTSLTYIGAIDERLYTLETCCGWWVRTDSRAANRNGPEFSRAAESAPDAARDAALYRHHIRISGRADSTDAVLYEEERTLPGAPGNVFGLACVAAASPARRHGHARACHPPPNEHSPSSGSGILTRFPFDARPAIISIFF
ncbi:hypothetical protein Ahia01_001421200 [Argonauta hians]